MGLLYEVCKMIKEDRTMDDAITPDEFEERLLTIRETAKNDYECTYRMNSLVIELLTDLGYEVGAEIYAESVIER